MKVNPYLNFDGQAEEAFNFYKSVFGGEFTANLKMGGMPEADKLRLGFRHICTNCCLFSISDYQ